MSLLKLLVMRWKNWRQERKLRRDHQFMASTEYDLLEQNRQKILQGVSVFWMQLGLRYSDQAYNIRSAPYFLIAPLSRKALLEAISLKGKLDAQHCAELQELLLLLDSFEERLNTTK